MFNKIIANTLPHLPKKLVWVFSKRYIAGETIDDGLRASRKLNEKNVDVTVDILGEFIHTIKEAENNRNEYLDLIKRFTAEKIKGSFSVKPTMFGLLIDEEVCYRNIREIVQLAVEKKSFVRIDMEDSQCVDMEIKLYKRLQSEFPRNVGLVLQAYLRRTFDDLNALNEWNTKDAPLNFRLCKGIYIESGTVAFKKYAEIRSHYLENLRYMFENRMYAAIATHDRYLVEKALELISEMKIPENMYEFQMLYGVTPELRQSVVSKGHRMRVYVPYGKDWFGYSTRRLKENPKMTQHIIKALFVRG